MKIAVLSLAILTGAILTGTAATASPIQDRFDAMKKQYETSESANQIDLRIKDLLSKEGDLNSFNIQSDKMSICINRPTCTEQVKVDVWFAENNSKLCRIAPKAASIECLFK